MILNTALLLVELWFLALLGLTLHRLSPRYGLTPIFLMTGALIGVIRVAAPIGIYVRLTPDIVFTVTGNVFVPIILLMVLVIYVADGTIPARITIYSILGAEVFSIVIMLVLRNHLRMEGGGSFGHIDDQFPILNPEWKTWLASAVAFTIDLYAIAIIFQAFHNYFPHFRRSIVAGATLLITLCINQIVFWSIAATSFAEFKMFFPSSLIGSAFSAVALWGFLALYLEQIIARLPQFQDVQDRPTFDLLFGSFARLEKNLVSSNTALREYSQLTDNMDDVFWVSDAGQEHFYYVSPSFEKLWGIRRDEVYQNPFLFLTKIHPDDQGRIFAALAKQHHGTYDEEFRLGLPDNEVRWLRARAFPLQQGGSVYRVVGIATDITASKQIVEQGFALEEARAKVTFLRHFINEATHDLKNPLTIITLKMSMLEKTPDMTKRQQYMNEVQAQMVYLTTFLDNMLFLAKQEQGNQLPQTLLDLQPILKELLKQMQVLGAAKNIALVNAWAKEPLMIQGNSIELRRVFTNLLDNALRYTPPQGTVTIRAITQENNIVVEISDTGIGISPHDLLHIFERDFRGNQARAIDISGSGLGLNIVKTLVEKHRGTITAESVYQQGTTFRVSLPRV